MPQYEEIDSPLKEKKKENSGEWLFRTLKPGGCILVLALAILLLVMCFTSGPKPIEGYAPPMSEEYYAENPGELAAELQANLLPHLEGIISCSLSGDKVAVCIEKDHFINSRAAILQYYDQDLFSFSQQ